MSAARWLPLATCTFDCKLAQRWQQGRVCGGAQGGDADRFIRAQAVHG